MTSCNLSPNGRKWDMRYEQHTGKNVSDLRVPIKSLEAGTVCVCLYAVRWCEPIKSFKHKYDPVWACVGERCKMIVQRGQGFLVCGRFFFELLENCEQTEEKVGIKERCRETE